MSTTVFDAPPPKQGNTITIILGIGLAVAVIAAVFFAIRANTLRNRVAELQTQLNQAQAQLEQAKTVITQLQPLAQKALQLPINLTVRKAMMGAGFVLQIHNQSGKSLPLKITLTNPTFNKTKTFDMVADAAPVPREIGHLEGWTLAPGDIIRVTSEGFESLETKVQ